jgi:hypothetical protein
LINQSDRYQGFKCSNQRYDRSLLRSEQQQQQQQQQTIAVVGTTTTNEETNSD